MSKENEFVEEINGRPAIYKALRLISPEQANDLGIAAEAPVFVSSFINHAYPCEECGVTYTPMVYQTGYMAESQHFHQTEGGIYSCVNLESALRQTMQYRGIVFIGISEPIGQLLIEPYGSLGDFISRSEMLRINAIKAYSIKDRNEVYEGFVDGFLFKGTKHLMSNAQRLPSVDSRYGFSIQDGEVHFRTVNSDLKGGDKYEC